MTLTARRSAQALPAEPPPTITEAARRMAATSRPLGLGAWREVSRSGGLPGDPDPDGTAAGLVRRWHQHLAVGIDLPMERLVPGDERLAELVTAWLDLARRTQAVRAHVARTAGPRTQAEALRQRALLAGLLADDLAVLGAPEPRRSALDLIRELEALASAEDVAGKVLRAPRRALLGAAPEPEPAGVLDRLARLLAGSRRTARAC